MISKAMRSAVALLALAPPVAACGRSNGDQAGVTGAATVVDVFAAASLTDAFADLALAFESTGQGYDVELNLGGSASLRAQILAGAPADVFASANTEVMADVAAAGAVTGPATVFATNRLAIAVPLGNPGDVRGLDDFERAELFLGICSTGVPCGDLADSVFAAAGLEPSLDTTESDVRSLLTKVSAGELDAGLVYATDVLAAADEVEGIEIPTGPSAETAYPIAVMSEAADPEGARAFVEFVLSADGRAILDRHGFGGP